MKNSKNLTVAVLLLALTLSPFLVSAKSLSALKNSPVVQATTKTKSAVVAVSMTAKDFAFVPSVINAKVGDTVKVTLTGADAKHSFVLPTFHVNTVVNPGQTKTFSFKVTKKGTFTFRCGVPCGVGHKDMTGTVIVS
jgi:heme/copper-type cytochrome/quinol oxidase subunit 2